MFSLSVVFCVDYSLHCKVLNKIVYCLESLTPITCSELRLNNNHKHLFELLFKMIFLKVNFLVIIQLPNRCFIAKFFKCDFILSISSILKFWKDKISLISLYYLFHSLNPSVGCTTMIAVQTKSS